MISIQICRKIWLSAFVLLSVIFFAVFVFPSAKKITSGFAAYYTASRMVIESKPLFTLYDDTAFRAEVEVVTNGEASDIFFANPPTTSLFFIPYAFFPIHTARVAWAVSELAAVLLIMLALRKILFASNIKREYYLLACSIFLLSVPLKQDFYYGQVYVMLLLSYTAALYAHKMHCYWLVGLCLALPLFLKASGIPILVLLILSRHWRVVAWELLSFVVLVGLSLPFVGISVWQSYLFNYIPQFLSSPIITVSAYQTLPGFIHHLFVYHQVWNPAPLADFPKFATVATSVMVLGMLIIAAKYLSKKPFVWIVCIGLILSVILIPTAEQHHYVLLFPVFLLGLSSSNVSRFPLALAALLIASPIIYNANLFLPGWQALFTYPRLYGAVILFVLLLQSSRNTLQVQFEHV